MMEITMRKWLFTAAALLISTACATQIPPPQTASRPGADPEKAWASHLSRFIDDKGRMDYAGMAKDPGDLETYLAYIARVAPKSRPEMFPTAEARLAFCINAYNALAMYDVLRSNPPPDLNEVKVTFFYKNRFEL